MVVIFGVNVAGPVVFSDCDGVCVCVDVVGCVVFSVPVEVVVVVGRVGLDVSTGIGDEGTEAGATALYSGGGGGLFTLTLFRLVLVFTLLTYALLIALLLIVFTLLIELTLLTMFVT